MHVILRYELGRDLFDEKVQVPDVPKIWNEKMKSYLGIEPRTEAEGALQDVHWGVGYFGYFPTYLLGAIAASQIFHAMEVDLGKEVLEECISKGDFHVIRKWLQSHVHEKGSLYPSMDDLLMSATGEPLNPKYYTEHLTRKYSELFL
jgi:carboxypeptidase Taq